MNSDLSLTPCTKIKSKWIQYLYQHERKHVWVWWGSVCKFPGRVLIYCLRPEKCLCRISPYSIPWCSKMLTDFGQDFFVSASCFSILEQSCAYKLPGNPSGFCFYVNMHPWIGSNFYLLENLFTEQHPPSPLPVQGLLDSLVTFVGFHCLCILGVEHQLKKVHSMLKAKQTLK